MKHVLIVDRPEPFRKNGVGRYLLEIAAAADRLQDAPPIRMLYFGRERTVAEWQQLVLADATPAKWQVWVNKNYGVAWGLRRSAAALIHYPTGSLHPAWDAGDTPRVLTLHGMGKYSDLPWYSQWQHERVDYLRQQFKRGRHKLKHIIAVSAYVKNQAIDQLDLQPEQITVVHNAIDFDRFYPEPNRAHVTDYLKLKLGLTAPYWFHLGPGGPRKNVLRQLKAFAYLKRKLNLPHKFLIAGLAGAKAQQSIQEQAQQLGVGDDVITYGEIRDDQRLRMLYNGADLFLFPSLYEGFGIPVIEAMACGTAVVTSNTHSLPEASGAAAALVDDPTDVDNLSDVIATVIEDSTYRQQLCQQGLAHARQHSWESSARQHIQVYQHVLQDSSL